MGLFLWLSNIRSRCAMSEVNFKAMYEVIGDRIFDLYSFLKQVDIVQIIVGGKRATDYLVRLLIAGIDRSRIVCCASETETVQHLQWDKFDKLMILYDLYNTESLSQIKKQLQEDAAI